MEEKIKDIYKVQKLSGNDPLVEWYNHVIGKTVDELTPEDVAHCIRQDLFVETAYEVLLAYLLKDPYIGDIYDGEFIEKAAEADNALIQKYHITLSEVLSKANRFVEEHVWDSEEDKNEFCEAIMSLDSAIHG